MRKRSAILRVLLTVWSGVGLLVAACARDSTAPDQIVDPERLAAEKKVDELKERYGWIGQYHTDGLVFVYNRLAQMKGRPATPEHLCRVAAQAVKEFHRQARKGEIPLGFVDESLATETCSRPEEPRGIKRNVMLEVPRIDRNQLSPSALEYMDAVSTAINSATSRVGLLSTLLHIQYAATLNLPEAEAGAIIGVVSIAISSMDYWEANLDAWVSVTTSIATPYVRIDDGANALMVPIEAGTMSQTGSRWWQNPFVKGYIKVVSADAMAGGRVLYTTWYAGAIGWDAAAAAALWASIGMALSLLF